MEVVEAAKGGFVVIKAEKKKVKNNKQMNTDTIEHGLRENWKQFTLLVLVNAFVGGDGWS